MGEDSSGFEILAHTGHREYEVTDPSLHPLDHPEVITFIDNELPAALATRLHTAVRPQLPEHPTEEERRDARTIQDLRTKKEHDTGQFLMRSLYEETFGVVGVITLGGLISHFDRAMSIGNKSTEPKSMTTELEALVPDIFNASFEESYAAIRNAYGGEAFSQSMSLLQRLTVLGQPTNTGALPAVPMFRPNVFDNPAQSHYAEQFKRGWLLLQALKENPSLDTQVSDPEVIAAFDLDDINKFPEGIPTRFKAISPIWGELGKVGGQGAFTEDNFAGPSDPQFHTALTKLATVRASKDFAPLYTHFSAKSQIYDRIKDNTR